MENLNTELYSHPIAIYKLNSEEKEVLAKLKKTGINCDSALNIITLNDDQIENLVTSAKDEAFKQALLNLQSKLISSTQYIRTFIAPISFSSIERELIECLKHEKTFPLMQQEVFTASISNTREELFASIAKKYKKSPKAIQKISDNIFQDLRQVFYYRIDKYKNYLKSADGCDLKLEMPTLWSMCQNNSFYNFIKYIFDLKEETWISGNTETGDINITACFDNIFSEVILPCSLETFRNSFYEYEGLNYSQINSLVPEIEKQNLIKIENKKVVSAKLSFKTAVIQVLLQSIDELSWDNIIEKIQSLNLYSGFIPSKKDFEETLGLYSSIIKSSENGFVHVNNSNLTISTIDRCVDKINSMWGPEEIGKMNLDSMLITLEENITPYELQHILYFM